MLSGLSGVEAKKLLDGEFLAHIGERGNYMLWLWALRGQCRETLYINLFCIFYLARSYVAPLAPDSVHLTCYLGLYFYANYGFMTSL